MKNQPQTYKYNPENKTFELIQGQFITVEYDNGHDMPYVVPPTNYTQWEIETLEAYWKFIQELTNKNKNKNK